MLVIENLALEDGQIYPKVFFDGAKDDLLEAIECASVITFTHALNGKTKELNVQAPFIVSYECEVDEEEMYLPEGLDNVKIILFPTAGFGKPVLDGLSPFEALLNQQPPNRPPSKKKPFHY